MPEYSVGVDQLRVGVFIRLDLKWYAHPFLMNSFKITKQAQIDTLREMGVETVICVPEKSDLLPADSPPNPPGPPCPFQPKEQSQGMNLLWEMKNRRKEELKKRRQSIQECEKKFSAGVATVKNVMRSVHTASPTSVEEADSLLHKLISQLSTDKESSVQLMNTELGTESSYYHSLNVSVLSIILGKECGLNAHELRTLGLGALFHDVGKSRLPYKLTSKTGCLSPVETACIQLHPKYGEDILSRIPTFPDEALDIVLHHHETLNGKGYPDRLSGGQIPPLTMIASIVNIYDNYCNSPDPKDSLTPHETLSRMFSLQKEMFDTSLLVKFIQCLGVYPPGTLVKLSNDLVGMVLSVPQRAPLRPSVIVYDPEIPKEEALIFDLRDDPSISIEESIRPGQLNAEMIEYLSPRTRITYYLASSEALIPSVKTQPLK